MDFEHATMSSSRLRPPSKVQIPTASAGLAEMTASDTNVRSAMAPPAMPAHTLKHKASGSECKHNSRKGNEEGAEKNNSLTRSQPPVFESQNNKMQRQTLAERAGQPHSSRSAPSTIRQVNGDVKRVAQNGPSSKNSFSSTHGTASRGLAAPGFANSTTTRPGMSRAQTSMSHSRSRSQYGQRPASAAGHNRALSASTMGQNIPAAVMAAPTQQVNSNGTVPPFSSLTAQQPNVITSYNVQQRPVKKHRQQRRQCRKISESSNATTLVNSSTCSSLSDPFESVSTVSSTDTGNRVSSLTTRFASLGMDSKSEEKALQQFEGEDAPIVGYNASRNDRSLMPPPSLPPPSKALKHVSSLPVLSPKKQNSAFGANTSIRRSTTPQYTQEDLSFVKTPRKSGSPSKQTPKKTPKTTQKVFYASKDSLTPLPAWTEEAIERRLRGFDDVMQLMNKQMEGTTFNHQFLKDTIESQRDQLAELTMQQKSLGLQNESLKEELGELKEENSGLVMVQTELQRNHEIEVDEMERKQRHEVENLREEHRKEVDGLRRKTNADHDETIRSHRHEIDEMARKHRIELEDMERKYKSELEAEKAQSIKEVEEISQKRDEAISRIASGIGEKEREADAVRDELVHKQADLDRERLLRASLESKFSETSANLIALESSNVSMKAKINYLESGNQQQSQQFADLHKRMQEAIEQAMVANAKLRAEESVRRKLHNQIQELKGNIRVFCRVRPTLSNDEGPAEISFPDTAEESKEIIVKGDEKTSALGKVTATNYAFNFDRVFGPGSQNSEVFDEISQLVQSSLDGYNVCIFCYGQTGSGKTHTMSSADGMIPRAVRQIYETAKELEEKGWTYRMTGQFVEVYNENINDLLGKSEDLDKKKHDIKHDMKTSKTTITDVEVMPLDSPDMVTEVLERADKNRSVAATKANMRSSRSHSVFILTLVGENSITGEKCEGTLNLVDLAGSERLAHSQAEGARLKETQSINKSLSCLGDVIGALGQKGEGGHVPYRNSKLTYLLQFSLGGNSKTLMFVMVSPLQAHLAETLTSLKFATKVHNTHVGTAKRQSKTLH